VFLTGFSTYIVFELHLKFHSKIRSRRGRGAFQYAVKLHYGIGIDADLELAALYYAVAALLGYIPGPEFAYRCLRGLGKATFSEDHCPNYFHRRALLLSRHESNRPYTVPTKVSDYLTKPRPPPTSRELIGTGGSSAVHLETNQENDRKIAVKQIFAHGWDEMLFMREIEALIKLNHPCVVRILGFNLPPLTEFAEIQMEYAQNGSLESMLRKVAARSIPRFWDPTGIGIIICGIVLGMRFVHSQGFIHRDLKPSNILINERGEALIADFGTSRSEYDNDTFTGDAGTVNYAAPEMYKEEPYTNKVDVFSFGVVLYEILVGRRVFPISEPWLAVMKSVLGGEMPAIPDRVGNVMKSLISRCWSLKAEDRPSFDDILKEFQTEHFAVVPGASAEKVFEYARSVLDWESCCSKRGQTPD
jgi:serine/threonine protein kinase